MSDELGKKLLGTTDAEVWAEEFVKIFNIGYHADGGVLITDAQEGLMLSWFACAIETGRNQGRKETCVHTWGQLDEGLWHCVVCGELNEALNKPESERDWWNYRS